VKNIIDFLKGIILAIVYPDRLLSVFRVRNLDQNSNKILGNDKILKIIAFVVAVGFVLSVRYTPTTTTSYSETATNITLVRKIDQENYTYFGSPIPQTIDIVLAGDRTDISLLIASGELTAYIDLTDLETGEHDTVVINVGGVPQSITATPVPNVINGVEIDLLVSEEFKVIPVERLPELDSRYSYGEIRVEPEYVTVTGPQRFIEEINEVQVMFNLTEEELIVGTITKQGVVIAQDIGLDTVRGGLEFYPATVSVTVEIYEDLRPVRILANRELIGVPSSEVRINNVISSLAEIQVWGDFEQLVESITLPRINFADLDSEGRVMLPVNLPRGLFSDITEVEVLVIYEELPDSATTNN